MADPGKPIIAVLSDGRHLQFPAGTAPDVVQNTVKREMASPSKVTPPAQPEPGMIRRIWNAGKQGFDEFYGESPKGDVPYDVMVPIKMGLQGIKGAIGAVGGSVGQVAEEMGMPGGKEEGLAAAELAATTPIAPEFGFMTGPASGMMRTGVTGPLLKPAKNLEKGAAAAQDVVSAHGGGVIPAQQLTTGAVLDSAANVAAGSILGGSRMRAATRSAEQAAVGAVDDFVANFPATKENVGAVIQDMYNEKGDVFRAAAAGAYRAVDQAMAYDRGLGPDAMHNIWHGMVDLRPTKQELLEGFTQMEKGLDKPMNYRMFNELLQKDDFVTFEQAQIIRSDLLGIGRKITEDFPERAQALSKRLSPFVDRAMSDAARDVGPHALAAWRNANSFYRTEMKTFNSKVLKAVARKEPEEVYQSIIRPGHAGSIRRVRELVGPEVWEDVEGRFIRDIWSKASDDLGNVSGDSMMRQIHTAKGSEVFGEVLTKDNAAYFEKLARTLQIVQGTNKTNALRMKTTIGGAGIGSLPEGGAAFLMYKIGVPATAGEMVGQLGAGALLLTPRTLSRILTSKTLNKLLLDGIGKEGLAGERAAGQLIAALVAQGLVSANQVPGQNMQHLRNDTQRRIARYKQQSGFGQPVQ